MGGGTTGRGTDGGSSGRRSTGGGSDVLVWAVDGAGGRATGGLCAGGWTGRRTGGVTTGGGTDGGTSGRRSTGGGSDVSATVVGPGGARGAGLLGVVLVGGRHQGAQKLEI
jgi:hypothetical protein